MEKYRAGSEKQCEAEAGRCASQRGPRRGSQQSGREAVTGVRAVQDGLQDSMPVNAGAVEAPWVSDLAAVSGHGPRTSASGMAPKTVRVGRVNFVPLRP